MPEIPLPRAAAPPSPRAESTPWRLQLLGGFTLDHVAQHHLGGLRGRAAMLLLARLALAPTRHHPREELVDMLWPDAAGDVGRNRLRQTLSVLRAALEPPGGPAVLLTDRRTLRILPGALWCDAAAFELAVRDGAATQARTLYGGELLPGFYDEWVLRERARLQALADRLDEMPATATHAAPTWAKGLQDLSGASSPGLSMRSQPARLPTYLTRLVGAEAAQARLRALAKAYRLVTVLGAGGVGKTRLAVEVAQQLAALRTAELGSGATGPSGAAASAPFERVLFVSLVDCHTDAQMLDRLKLALRLEAAGDAAAQLVDALDAQAVLLVLDNCEQLDDAATARIAWLAERLPQAHWLATSRRPLGLDGEREFLLAPLVLPAALDALASVAQNPAVTLFIDRARLHRPNFQAHAENCESLVALVCWLDGLPLAIELAASRSRTLGAAQMLALLQTARTNAAAPAAALSWLSRRGTRSGSDPRHASMLAVIEWSWKLLPGPLQGLLDAVCGLPAGAGLAAAAALARPADPPALAETLTMLDDLVAHSMLQQRTGQDGQPRYFASEPVRDYAAGRRTPADALAQRRHRLDWLLRWAQALAATPPLPEVREEMPNLIAALEAAGADGAADAALRLVLMLQSSWGEIAIPGGALDLLGRLLALPGLDPSLAGGAHAVAAWSCFESGRREDARRHAALALAQPISDEPLRAMALSRVARVRWRMDRDAGAARALLATGLPLARALGRANTEAAMLSLEAHLAATIDRDPARGAALNRQAQALWERSGNVHLINAGRYNTAVNHQQAGRHAQAMQEFAALADAGRAMQDWDLLAGALDASGSSWLALRRWEKSAQALHESLQVAWQAMEIKAVAFALWNIPPALARCGQATLAAQTMGFAERFWQLRFGDLDASDRRDLKRVRRFARCGLGVADTSAAWRVGRERSLAEAVQAVLGR